MAIDLRDATVQDEAGCTVRLDERGFTTWQVWERARRRGVAHLVRGVAVLAGDQGDHVVLRGRPAAVLAVVEELPVAEAERRAVRSRLAATGR